MDSIGVSWPAATGAYDFPAQLPEVRSGPAPAEQTQHGWRSGLPVCTVARVSHYMQTHIGESITLEALARVACMSRFHFARRFRQSTGSSPMAYLLAMRIARAQRLLEQGESKIADIAAELGFFDQSHFTRTFRRSTGMSPRAYARSSADVPAQAPASA